MPRILVIDDDDQIRKLFRKTLVRYGFDVIEANNGKEGIAHYRNEPVDLVITDIIMPEKEGIETILELKRDFPDVKIIAISGGGRIGPKSYLSIAERLGVAGTIEKPVGITALLEAIHKALSVIEKPDDPRNGYRVHPKTAVPSPAGLVQIKADTFCE